MKKLLITGGPVHAHIDDVKIVTNRFRGGLMADLAHQMADLYPGEVVYLTAPGAKVPPAKGRSGAPIEVRYHQGFADYQKQVLELADSCSDMILGAAVANLIPLSPIQGKFPSHNYKEGDVVSLDFVVTPRVITQVKKRAPHLNLFGFKLLSNAPHEELMASAWHTLVSSRAAAVVANDTRDLLTKYVRTREGGVHPLQNDRLAEFLLTLMQDEFYASVESTSVVPDTAGAQALTELLAHHQAQRPDLFVTMPDGMVLGTAAIRAPAGFWTTGRGKRELQETAFVGRVEHTARKVHIAKGHKASLNAPLLDRIFCQVPAAQSIVHGHVQDTSLPLLPYAQPGTVRDSLREVAGSFCIEGHGSFYVYDSNNMVL